MLFWTNNQSWGRHCFQLDEAKWYKRGHLEIIKYDQSCYACTWYNHINPKDNKIQVTKCHSTTSSYTTLQLQCSHSLSKNLGALPPLKKKHNIFLPQTAQLLQGLAVPTTTTTVQATLPLFGFIGFGHWKTSLLHHVEVVCLVRGRKPTKQSGETPWGKRNAMVGGKETLTQVWWEGKFVVEGNVLLKWMPLEGTWLLVFSIIGNFGGMEWHGSWIRSDMAWKWQIWDLGYLLFFVHFLLGF